MNSLINAENFQNLYKQPPNQSRLIDKPIIKRVRRIGIATISILISTSAQLLFALPLKSQLIADVTDTPLKESKFNYTPEADSVHGKVTDSKGKPLAGVSISVKGTNIGTSTNGSGNYSITVTENGTLVFSYVGYTTKEVPFAGKSIIDVTLETETTSLEKVVVTGYSTQRKVDLTGAVSIVNPSAISDLPGSSTITALQGRIPGVFIEVDGRPNGGQNRLLIRGLNTLGNTNPLFIIDGVPTLNQQQFRNIEPSMIESIQVLKDATAASIYGARASNGVVIVTTKRGSSKMQVKLNSSYTRQVFTQKLPVLNTHQRGQVLWQASINDKTPVTAHQALYTYVSRIDANGVAVLESVNTVPWIGGNPNGLTPSANTDWQDEVFHNGSITNTDISISNGTENSTMLIGFNYLNNQGIIRHSQYRRYAARVNTSFDIIKNKLKIGENVQLSLDRDMPMPTDLGGSDMINLARFLQPILPVYRTDGKFAGPIGGGFSDRNNPLHMLTLYKDNFNRNYNIFGNVYAEITPIKNLLIRSNFGIDYIGGYNFARYPAFQEGFIGRSINYMQVEQNHRLNWTWSNTANYDVVFGKHIASILLGTEAIKNQYRTLIGYKEGFALEDINYYQLSAGTGNQTTSGNQIGNQLLSYFGKVNYNYADKYLLAMTLRRDGSSRFGTENEFGLFPSVSAGWRLNNESFFQNIVAISNLKIRAGWGRVGNQEIGDDSRFGQYMTNYGTNTGTRTTGTGYDINGANGGTLPSGYARVQLANPNLKWETTEEINTGVDFGLFQEKVYGSFDYFSRTTSNILIRPPYVATIGEGGSQWQNGATVENKGFEITAGYRDHVGDLTFSVGVNVGSFNNKVTKLPASVVRAYPGNTEKTILGHSPLELFGYVAQGIFQTQAEVDEAATQPGKRIGRIRYADLNGDRIINQLDQDWLGDQLPKGDYGINVQLYYKNFDVSLFGNGIYGRKINNSIRGSTDFIASGMNMGKRVLNAWTPQNTSSTIPMLTLVDANSELSRFSSYFAQNGDYFKLRTVQLGYTLSKTILQKIGMQQLRIYALAENSILLFRKKGKDAFTAMDPEDPGSLYPRPVNYSLGVNVTF
ncbi:MAG: TonB-dependent receptor [Chitinophagaceae bacterium]